MGDKFISEDGSVGFDFDKVDSHGGDFGENSAPEGVGESEVDVLESEVNGVGTGLDGL